MVAGEDVEQLEGLVSKQLIMSAPFSLYFNIYNRVESLRFVYFVLSMSVEQAYFKLWATT